MKKANTAASLILMIALLTSCAGETIQPETDDTTDDTTTLEETTADIYADLPEGDFGGEEFVFANETESKWAILTLNTDDVNGEVINDAIYNRNRLVEDRLKVKIRCEEHPNSWSFRDTVSRNILAGDDPFDVIDINSNLSAPLILEGYFLDAEQLGLDLTKPWWNKTVMESLTYADRTYSLASDMSVMIWDASLCFMFNKSMSADLGLEDHYELVKSGKWTLDKAGETMKAAARDVNGDSKLDTEDNYGLTANLRLMSYLITAGDEMIVDTDKDGLPTFNGLTSSLSDRFDKIFRIFFDNDEVFISARGQQFKDSTKNWHSIFVDGQALYFFEPIGSCAELRDSKFDYGFLPLPKYNEAQEDYITPIIHFAHVMHVSKCNEDIEKISAVLENLAAESHKTVRPAYFTHIIDGKRVQDDDTVDMFNIIFAHQVMNPACIYDWGQICTTINNAAQNRDPDISSKIAGITPAVKDAIAATVEFYSK